MNIRLLKSEEKVKTVFIQMKNGKRVLIDYKDRDLAKLSWHVAGRANIAHTVYTDGKQKHILLRRVIAERAHGPLKEKDRIFHRNGIYTDCTRDNLIIGRGFFLPQKRTHSSSYKGVRRIGKKWHACFVLDGKRISLGYYQTPEEAAWEYNCEMIRRDFPPDFLNTFDENAQKKLERILEERIERRKKKEYITLQSGQVILLSKEDSDLSLYRWHYHRTMGVARRLPDEPGRPYVFLKRIIAQRMLDSEGRTLQPGENVTFANDIYDYRRENLILFKKSERRRERGIDQYITFDEYIRQWIVVLPKGQQLVYFGPFRTRDAAIASYYQERRRLV